MIDTEIECGRCRTIHDYDDDLEDLARLAAVWLFADNRFVCPGCQSPADKMSAPTVSVAARRELARRELQRRGGV